VVDFHEEFNSISNSITQMTVYIQGPFLWFCTKILDITLYDGRMGFFSCATGKDSK
jgi:hypothetical protein